MWVPLLGTRFTWDLPITYAGGQYRLCWCGGGTTCETAPDYHVDAGGVLVIGPAPLVQARTCIAGQTCEMNIYGVHLEASTASFQNGGWYPAGCHWGFPGGGYLFDRANSCQERPKGDGRAANSAQDLARAAHALLPAAREPRFHRRGLRDGHVPPGKARRASFMYQNTIKLY